MNNGVLRCFTRNARLFCLTSVALTAGRVFASNVAWNTIEIEEDFGGGSYTIRYPYVTMQAKVADQTLVLWADAYEYMEFASSWVVANNGDNVSVRAIQDAGSYFYSADFNVSEEPGVVHTDYPISIKKGESVYLAVISRTFAKPEDYEVGWVELYYGTDGTLISKLSALDYDGGTLVVGATPEPTSGLLLLLGMGALALRRRRA